MSNVKTAIDYAAKLYRDAMNGRLNADTSDTTQLLNEAFAKAFEAYKSDREGWVGLTDEEITQCSYDSEGFMIEREVAMAAVEAKLKEKNT